MTTKPTGSDELGQVLRGAEDQLWVDFKQSGAFAHRGNRGTGRELALAAFLNDHLPGRFTAVAGEVIDIGGERSGQIDILLYDHLRTVPLLTQSDGKALIGAEALLAVIEVKSTLTKNEIAKAIAGLSKIRRLRPWGQPWARFMPRGQLADTGPRFFSTLFAFDTNLGASGWALKELTRLRDECAKAGLPAEHVDRVAVLSHGMLLPAEGLTASHKHDRQVLGMWYSALLNFITREVDRRKEFPWTDYESSDGREWDRTMPPAFTAPAPTVYSKTQIRGYRAGRRPGSI